MRHMVMYDDAVEYDQQFLHRLARRPGAPSSEVRGEYRTRTGEVGPARMRLSIDTADRYGSSGAIAQPKQKAPTTTAVCERGGSVLVPMRLSRKVTRLEIKYILWHSIT